MISKSLIDDFLAINKVALVGVSVNKNKFGNTLFRELIKRNYQVIPVHPSLSELDGIKCVKSIADLPDDISSIIIATSKSNAIQALKEVSIKGIKFVWLQQSSDSPDAIEFCTNDNITLIYGLCLLMFLTPSNALHKFHAMIMKLFRQYPK